MSKLKLTGGGTACTPSEKKENLYTNEDLKIMQGWSLDRKIQVTQTRILEWYQKWDGQVYVSFSGGKDSTVLADLAARVCKASGYKLVLWFSNTGLEYPEVVKHVKFFSEWIREKYEIEVELVMDYPRDRKGKRVTFKDVVFKYGYPLISKEVSQKIYEARKTPSGAYAARFKEGNEHALKYGNRYSMVKWNWLKDSDIPISHLCCNYMKKSPAKKFEKKTGLKPIVATMACESSLRKTVWLKQGCNAFDNKRPTSQPLSFWLEQDVLRYLHTNSVPVAKCYGEIVCNDGTYITTGYDRTGCMFCAFGVHLQKEPNKFQKMKLTHPKIWHYCMKPVSEGGLGMREVLEYINVKVE